MVKRLWHWWVGVVRKFYVRFDSPLFTDPWFVVSLLAGAAIGVYQLVDHDGFAAVIIFVFMPTFVGFLRELVVSFRTGWRG